LLPDPLVLSKAGDKNRTGSKLVETDKYGCMLLAFLRERKQEIK